MRYKIVHRSITTGQYKLILEDGKTVLDHLHWVPFTPRVGDTGDIIQTERGNKMIPDAFESE